MLILTLQTSTFSVYGGIPTYNRMICRALNELNGAVENHILLGTDKPSDIQPGAAQLPALQLEAFNGNRAAFVRRVLDLVIGRRIDLMLIGHVNYAPLGLMLRRLQPGLRYGVMVHGVDVWTRLPALRRRALQQADFIISVSEYTKQKAIEVNDAAAEHFYLLPNVLQWDIGDGTEVSAPPSLPKGTRLLTVCRLASSERYKGVDTVIESLPAVAAHVPDVQYLIVGDGTDVGRLKGLANEVGVADRVHFLGLVDDAVLRGYYQTCDAFVMPSAKEGFGIVFLEAMQYGKPVIAANVGGSPEVVENSVTGLLVEYGNVPQLVQAITDLCLDPEKRRRLGQAGYRRLQEQFTYPHFKQRLTDILRREISTVSMYRDRRRLIGGSARAV